MEVQRTVQADSSGSRATGGAAARTVVREDPEPEGHRGGPGCLRRSWWAGRRRDHV